MTQLISRTDIKRHAEQTARDGKGPEACPYAAGTDAEYYWKDCFAIATHRVMEAREVA